MVMNSSVKNIIIRVIKSRMDAGEDFDTIIKSYPRLKEAEIEEIRAALLTDTE